MDPDILAVLVCPVTRQPLVFDAERQELVSPAARLAFPVRDGIPVMLEDEARPLGPALAMPAAAAGTSPPPAA